VNETVARHLYFTLDGGYEYSTSTGSASISFNIYCDSEVYTISDSDFSLNETDTLNPIISFSHESGCATYSLSTIVIFFDQYPWVLGVLLLIFGPIVNFFGRRFIPWVIAILGGGVSALIVLVFCSAVGMLDYADPTETGGNVGLVILAILLSILAGVGVGFLLK